MQRTFRNVFCEGAGANLKQSCAPLVKGNDSSLCQQSQHKLPTASRSAEDVGGSTERRLLRPIQEKSAMARRHHQPARRVRYPKPAAQTGAGDHFLPALMLFVMRCGRPTAPANAGVLHNVARPEFASAP